MGLRPWVARGSGGQRRQRRAILFHRMDLGLPRQRQGEGAQPGEQIGDLFGAFRSGPAHGLAAPPRLRLRRLAGRHAAAASHAAPPKVIGGAAVPSRIVIVEHDAGDVRARKGLAQCRRSAPASACAAQRKARSRPVSRFGDMDLGLFAFIQDRRQSASRRRCVRANSAGVSTRHSRMSTMAWLLAAWKSDLHLALVLGRA